MDKGQSITQRLGANPLVIAIAAATAAAVGNLIVSLANSRNEIALEAIKAEQSLVLEAIKTDGDREAAKENLLFLVRSGLLPKQGAAVTRALTGKVAPTLSSHPSAADQTGLGYFPPEEDLKAVTETKPKPSPDILTDPSASARYNSAVLSWGERVSAAGRRLCRFHRDTGMKVEC